MWNIWWTPNNTSKWQMGFNSQFKTVKQEFDVISYSRCGQNKDRILNWGSCESKQNCFVLLYSFKLKTYTCFGPCTGPPSGHKIYNWWGYTVWIIDKIVWIIKIGYMELKFKEISLSFYFPMVYMVYILPPLLMYTLWYIFYHHY